MPKLTRKHFRMYASWLKRMNESYFPNCEDVLGYAQCTQPRLDTRPFPNTQKSRFDANLLDGIVISDFSATEMKQRITHAVTMQLQLTNDHFNHSQFKTAAGWYELGSKTKES